MKVGLCCCYDNHNYGSMLQSLANFSAIEALGHECEIVRYRKQYSLLEKVWQTPRVLNGGYIDKRKRQSASAALAAQYPQIQRMRERREPCFDSYCKRTFTSVSDAYIGYEALKAGSTSYDAVMVGSDQLWLPMGLPTNFYNLQFAAPGVRRISYATSFGVSSIPWYQKRRTADFLRKIDCLSVREDSGAKICRDIAGVDAEVVVDPTLLLKKDEWQSLIPISTPVEEPYIFCYFLGTNPLCRQETNALCKKTGLPTVVLRHMDEIVPSDEAFGDIAPYDIDPAAFVNLIRNAEYVLTDSFHGTVFSALHHKRFATYYRFTQDDGQSRNSRIDSLFAHLGLEARLVTQTGGTLRVLDADIDFGAVDARLAEWRSSSWDFLREALS